MYTEERSGKTQLMDTDGSVVEPERLEKDVRVLLEAKETTGTGGGGKGGSGDKDPPKDPPGGGGGHSGGVPENIPQNRTDFRAFVSTKYAELVQKYQKSDHTARPEYLPLIEELRKYQPGELGLPTNEAKSKDILARWAAIGKQIAAEPGSSGSTEAAELRTLYNRVEKEDMPAWQQELQKAGVSKEVQARLANLHRTEIKLFTRDLMTDESSKELLYLRDLAVYGNRNGPTFDWLMEKNTDPEKGKMTQDQSYDAIIKGSQTSNKNVNKDLTGSDTGIKKDDKPQ
jgi:hypothetical protein